MTKQRRIISPALTRHRNAVSNTPEGEGRSNDETSLSYFIAPVVLLIVTHFKDLSNAKNSHNNRWMSMILIAASVFILFVILLRRKPKHKLMEAIALYPLGIQMGTISVVDPNSSDIKLSPNKFLHRETIVDCIVTELVYSCKVQSSVMLRINQDVESTNTVRSPIAANKIDAHHDDDDDDVTDKLARTRTARENVTNLVRLFSDVEMTYMECLEIRSQINNYLQRNDISVDDTRCEDTNQ